MPANVEIKAKIKDFDTALSLASKLADDPKPTILEQRDTFFLVPNGRLKLRKQKHVQQKEGEEKSQLTFAELIAYNRTDVEGPKQSTYSKSAVEDPESLEKVLAISCGIKGVVKKVRHLFLVDRTRIHLDRVEGLPGAFLELEVVLKEAESLEDGRLVAKDLMNKLNVIDTDLIAGAYMDMLNAGEMKN